jgi:hypothetical protein
VVVDDFLHYEEYRTENEEKIYGTQAVFDKEK